MNNTQGLTGALGFRGRLTLAIVSLVLVSVLLIASIVYIQYRNSYTQATINQLQGTGEMMSESFSQWLDARQGDMRYIAELNPVRERDTEQITHLLSVIASQDGYYDTIYFVDPNGRGLAGVSYDGRVTALSADEAFSFNVADRSWFQTAIRGEEVFSQPLVSRATGNQVSNIVVPVYDSNQEIVGVVRAAVSLEVLFRRMEDMSVGGSSDTYLLAADGNPVTPVAALRGENRRIDTHAARLVAQGENGIGQYPNAVGTPVIGSVSYLNRLSWGVVLEVPEAQALAEVNRVFWMLVMVTAAIIAVAIVISLLVVRSVVKTLGGDPQVAADVVRRVAEGDLTVTVPVQSGDKTSLLAHIHDMQTNLQRMMGEINRYSDEVAAAATELTQVNSETEKGIEHQTEQVSSVAVAMNEMTATVEEVARNTQETAEGARSTTEEADRGREVVDEAIKAIQKLAEEISESADVVSSVKQDSDNIGSVLQVIRDVAEQTNLLALNAAIEAARAGEEGRGFAVVADEVRTLASRTQTSAAQIQKTVETLQTRADQATRSMEVSRDSAYKGVEQVTSAGISLNKIAEAVSRIDDMAQQIATATEEQTAVAQEINESVHTVSAVTEQNARNVDQSKQASEALAQLAEELRGMVQQFRV
ncbi:methyl-accepting chemotaxis protein [Marinimicrobium alkaliphilum]|uniref:methyl-accepting chemotaxis protein n=1 Tax=Marinimicrobium alkaliphilum TaxID=2202654 RepID=UPI000DB9CF3E|nr:methyl-accepting chemotaxis protein [Marinimicrobium alkaliphilum]